jgi:hypothetical protein
MSPDRWQDHIDMYTVLRVTGDNTVTLTTADAINAVSPGAIKPRHRNDGFAATIIDSGEWRDHVRAIEAFVQAHRDLLADATARGVSVQFDIAIGPEDRLASAFTSVGCPPHLHRELGAIGAWLVFSWYTTD